MIGDVFSVPWLSGLAWKYTNIVWKTTQHSRFWLVNVRATRASYWPDLLCTVHRGLATLAWKQTRELVSGEAGAGASLLSLAVCLRVPGRGEYCALCLCLPAIPHKIFTRNIMGFKTIQTQPRSAWPAVWLVDVKQPLISALIIPSPSPLPPLPAPMSGLVSNIRCDITHNSNHNHFQ